MAQVQVATPFGAPLIWGAKGGCFPSDTQILTPTGSLAIEDCQIGDKVLCYTPDGEVLARPIIETYTHGKQELLQFVFGASKLTLTPNHWVLKEDGQYDYASEFEKGDYLLDLKSDKQKILEINSLPAEIVYTLTVKDYHTFFANGFRVHNKGGGKGGGSPAPAPTEEPNNLFSTDIVLTTIAMGEGPIYRINPLGPQDIEINEGTVDDLINLDGDGEENTDVFRSIKRTGTLTQTEMPVFGTRTVIPQSLASQIVLRQGNINGVPASDVTFQNTSADEYSELIFTLQINQLLRMDEKGSIFNYNVTVKVTVYDRTGTTVLGSPVTKEFFNKTNIPYAFQMIYPIPKADRSTRGYKFSIQKVSLDSASSKIQDQVSFRSWLEIKEERTAYPRTAAVGYALKAHNEHVGGVPTFTSVIKGLLIRVPSNYDQPILKNGEIDWAELELPESGVHSYVTNGYRLQSSGTDSVVTTLNPKIYKQIWDGTFVYSWTQNPVWIIFDLLTNDTYGLGIPLQNIDKFQFYKIAQYCDGVDSQTGQWSGVDGFSDGSYRHKPRLQFESNREKLIGINEGIAIKERRFILDIILSDQQQAMDLLSQICGTIRAILFYSGGKLSLQIDMPDEIPVMIFNESNITPDSSVISGISESEVITGLDVSYVNPSNHYKRETMRVDDPTAIVSLNQIENISSADLPGVTRRSQAMRFAQYMIASSKYIRRKIVFGTDTSAISLTPGDLIAVQQRVLGTAWGYGGRVSANGSLVGSSSRFTGQHANVTLEHFTSPAITDSTFTSNTLPVGLRVFSNRNEDLSLYILSNTFFTVSNSGPTTYAKVRLNSTSGSGKSANVNVRRYDAKYEVTFPAYSANVNPGGYGFAVGDTITITGNTVGGVTSTNDCTLTVISLTSTPSPTSVTGQINTFAVSGTSISSFPNVYTGSDSVTVRALELYDQKRGNNSWNTNFAWTANTVPARGDSWTLGEVNPNNFYRDTTDKLFKVTGTERDEEERVIVTASEYIPNVYVDSDTAINYTPVRYEDTFSPLVPPPVPEFQLTARPIQLPDGTIQTDIEISDTTNTSGYPIAVKPVYQYAVPSDFSDILQVIP